MTLTTATITATAGALFSTSFAPAPTGPTRAPIESLLDPSHPDPTRFDSTDPIILFIIQAFVIIAFARVLGVFLAKLRQPRVISEVLGGILLGPTAFGRIPHFTAHIFPPASLPYLSLVATIGLVFFLFLVGVEVEFSVFRRNAKPAALIAGCGMAIPFGLGCAVSVGLYKHFISPETPFTHFMIFIGTSMSITAFPVLARILTELRLVNDAVGAIVLSAGVCIDVVAWCLLALSIALANASSGVIVVYTLLAAIGWATFLILIVRPVYLLLVRKSGSFETGPTQSIVCLTLLLALVSAFVTDRIGVHAIFGGFLAGLLVPHEHGFGHRITEKVEDMIVAIFIPIYFALSGLKTNLGLLNTGTVWAWVVCVACVDFFGKFLTCSGAARAYGLRWRESAAVGSLMSCKGLVELIVLNIALSAGILNTLVFSIFVFEALILTFVTTPLTLAFYPPHIRRSYNAVKGGTAEATVGASSKGFSRITVILERLEHLSPAMSFAALLVRPSAPPATTSSEKSPSPPKVAVNALRLVEDNERFSSLMQASERDATMRSDHVASVFSTFARLSAFEYSASLAVTSAGALAHTVASHVEETQSDFVLVPWKLARKSEEGIAATYLPNPFESLLGRATGGNKGSPQYASMLRSLFAQSPVDVGVFLDREDDVVLAQSNNALPGSHHLFLAFHGGADDRACLHIILQLAAANPAGIAATVVRMAPGADDDDATTKHGSEAEGALPSVLPQQYTLGTGSNAVDTVYPTQNKIVSETMDEVAFDAARSRIQELGLKADIVECRTSTPLKTAIARVGTIVASSTSSSLTLLAGRGRRDAPSQRNEINQILKENVANLGVAASSEVRRSIGDVATSYLVSNVGHSLLIVQSSTPSVANKTQ